MSLSQERERLINEFNKIEIKTGEKKKEIIQRLAKNLQESIKEKRPEITNMCNLEKVPIEESSITALLYRISKKNKWSISDPYIRSLLPSKFKRDYDKEIKEPSPMVRMTDNYLLENFDELKERHKSLTQGPAKEPKTKERVDDMERYTWNCHAAQELAKLAIKMEKEHNEHHEDKLCKDYSVRIKSVRDKRFATSINNYEAIILAANNTTSLKDAVSGEWEFKTFWEIIDDMNKCRECLGFEQCKKEKCKHECHRVIRPMTTKGYKFAIRTNQYLKDWDNTTQKLSVLDDDLCRLGKTILENTKSDKFLNMVDKERLIYAHIEKMECLQCETFLEKKPNFFKTNK